MSDEKTPSEWAYIGNNIMFALMEQDEFSADDFYTGARSWAMPPATIKRLAGALFRQFQAAGYIEKSDRYRLSDRNGSAPLPIWQKVSASHKLPHKQVVPAAS
ncbi:MAG: hypothetical protein WCS42_00935 [Verrucomicrobiota bacterium]